MLKDTWVNVFLIRQTSQKNNEKVNIGSNIRAKFETKSNYKVNDFGVRADSKNTHIILPFNKLDLDITSLEEIQEKDVMIEVSKTNNVEIKAHYFKESILFEGLRNNITFVANTRVRNTDITNQDIPNVD